jgi:hypothetical protein
MPSRVHEMLLLLFRNRPALAPELLRDALHVELPTYSEVRLESADLTDIVPAEYRADLVVLLVDGKPVLGIIVEVQLRPDPRKRFSWPVYVAGLHARLACPCCLLVITASAKTARWASKPINTGPGGQLLPFVVSPDGVPVITDPELAKRDPELAVLSVMAHGHGDVETAVKIALSAASSTAGLEADTRVLYFDLIEAALGDAARKAFAMLPKSYEFQGPTFKKGKLEGERAGKLEGQALMGAEAVLTILQTRGLVPTEPQRERLVACKDLDSIKAWIAKAVTAPSVGALFDE